MYIYTIYNMYSLLCIHVVWVHVCAVHECIVLSKAEAMSLNALSEAGQQSSKPRPVWLALMLACILAYLLARSLACLFA